eukprot:jgi/Bigna1/45749/e_gw1.157.8.1
MALVANRCLRRIGVFVNNSSGSSGPRLQGRNLATAASQSDDGSEYDYIIVGAGSAGCVLAHRLSNSNSNKVILVEGGGDDRWHWSSIFLHMPSALSIPMNMRRYNWGYEARSEPNLNGRSLHCPRGKVLGGSSSINGMAFVRGHPLDFDKWEDLGASGWNYLNCLPYFKRSESWQEGEDDYRGGNGPVGTSFGRRKNPLYSAFIEAGQQAGYSYTQDYNGYQQEGFGPMAMSVTNGVRNSTSNSYLQLSKDNPRLKVLTHGTVKRVVFDETETQRPRATGIVLENSNGKLIEIKASKEIILAAGAIGSPHLLQVSGIGDSEHLESIGVPLVKELKGVGKNLQDHLEILVQQECKQPITLYGELGPLSKLKIGVQWIMSLLTGGMISPGLGGTNHFESCAFVRSNEKQKYPDIQYHFCPVAISYDGNSPIEGHGFQAHVGPMRSKSRGYIKAVSRDITDHPEIKFNYMSVKEDWEEFRECIRLTRRIFAQPAFDQFRGKEIAPGEHVQRDDEIDAFIRERVESAYHPCGTCKMGDSHDPKTVVDPETRVVGVDGLRVVDSSIFPSITNGNLNAPTIMVAERASDLILGEKMLPPAEVDISPAIKVPSL